MSNLSKSIRAKRFKVKSGESIELTVESKLGAQLKLLLQDCSISGVGASMEGKLSANEGFEVGDILPSSKLAWGKHESSLGRLVVRSAFDKDGNTHLGFSTVDMRVPLDGPLSRSIEIDFEKGHSPFDYELRADKHSLANFAENPQNSADLFAKCQQFEIFHEEWKNAAKYLYSSVRLPSKGVRVNLQRTRKGGRNDYIIMGSNDYLGLASEPRVLEAAKKALDQYGFGSTGSPVSTGRTQLHDELCDYIARLYKKDSVLLYNSGYAANVGALGGITSAQDFVAADFLSHASIQDALQMSRATSRFFKHNDLAHLERILQENRDNFSGALVVTEGVFSMDGDLPPLKEMVKLAKKYSARTFVDEAHSLGVIGPQGLGACEKFGVTDQVDMIMGTFSKICGGIGGFIASSKDVVDWLYFMSRAHMFSVSIPPSTAAAALKALQIFTEEKELLHTLKANIKHFTEGLKHLGYTTPNKDHESAVVPVIVGDEAKLASMLQVFLEAGIFVVPVAYPAVSRKSCRFRFTVMATHTLSDLDYVLNTFERAMEVADFSFEQAAELSSADKKKVA